MTVSQQVNDSKPKNVVSQLLSFTGKFLKTEPGNPA